MFDTLNAQQKQVAYAKAAERITAVRNEAVPKLEQLQAELLRRQRIAHLRASVPPVFYPLFDPYRYKGAHGGRGSAKSWSFATAVLARAVSKKGTRIVCIREVQKSLEQSCKRLLEDRIQYYDLGREFRILNTHIETPGDGVIIFQGMQNHTAESIKSLEGFDIAWVEEAQSLSKRSLELLRPTIRKEGSELWFSWNPKHETDPVDELLRNGELPPNCHVVEANYKDNPFLPETLRVEMEYDRRRDFDKYQHVWLGQYERHSDALVFKNWTVEDFDTPEDAEFLLGGDFGFANDPDVLVRCFISGNKLYIDHEAYEIGCEIDDTPKLFDGLVCGCNYHRPDDPCQAPELHGWARSWNITADSSRPELISYLNRNGYTVKPAIKGPNSVEDGIKFVKMYDVIIHTRCVHTADEFGSYKYKRHKQTDAILPILEDKKNHVIDGVRYAVEDVRAEFFEYAQAGMTSDATW